MPGRLHSKFGRGSLAGLSQNCDDPLEISAIVNNVEGTLHAPEYHNHAMKDLASKEIFSQTFLSELKATLQDR